MTWETEHYRRTRVATAKVRRCRACGVLLHARDRCPCDTQTVHVITTLGPTNLPGLVVPAQLAHRHRSRP